MNSDCKIGFIVLLMVESGYSFIYLFRILLTWLIAVIPLQAHTQSSCSKRKELVAGYLEKSGR